MEYVAIEKSEYEQLLGTIKKVATEIRAIAEECTINSEWIENGELAEMLGLSIRQLQGVRGRGVLGFSTIGRKIYYHRDEVERLIKNNTIKRK
ncbi:MAG: helix-turn-helix domain-containing protein [Alistipes sp.]|nr:helix-turn-helix domain-containing protein [Alistipes sp.]